MKYNICITDIQKISNTADIKIINMNDLQAYKLSKEKERNNNYVEHKNVYNDIQLHLEIETTDITMNEFFIKKHNEIISAYNKQLLNKAILFNMTLTNDMECIKCYNCVVAECDNKFKIISDYIDIY